MRETDIAAANGLSPPTRGNRRRPAQEVAGDGSIPAHAGEPTTMPSKPPTPRVYPRPRGGTSRAARSNSALRGLSPPTRGNLKISCPQSSGLRSIPAHAGEPESWGAWATGFEVYPRPRGGTGSGSRTEQGGVGLSPPTRGNLSRGAKASAAEGSIPAHAGEPAPTPSLAFPARVYPRPRGGTQRVRARQSNSGGLSPPTRGNLVPMRPVVEVIGSIPAHAGEPFPFSLRSTTHSVYPRPRGGTGAAPPPPLPSTGLSPPTRGNLVDSQGANRLVGSIPAHAGEPSSAAERASSSRVYPRPRGGTHCLGSGILPKSGLSPPTRGNRDAAAADGGGMRSIPAHAGEP